MPLTAYVQREFTKGSLKIINHANVIIDEYAAMGFTLTLRQLYYQFVARGLIANKQTEYKRLGSIVNDARLAGLVDWEAIEDRTRNLRSRSSWSSPASIISSAAQSYHRDMWARQDYRPEVWIEKDALVGVIERVCERNDVPFFACRGYSSQSEQWRAGERFAEYIANGQTPIILHLGDHDPSGIDMTRDNQERLSLFANEDVEVRRLALNMPQVEELKPPPNPAKMTDSRFEGYARIHGGQSWELDALPPDYIENLITVEIDGLRDPDLWAEDEERTEEERTALSAASANWNDVVRWMEQEGLK